MPTQLGAEATETMDVSACPDRPQRAVQSPARSPVSDGETRPCGGDEGMSLDTAASDGTSGPSAVPEAALRLAARRDRGTVYRDSKRFLQFLAPDRPATHVPVVAAAITPADDGEALAQYRYVAADGLDRTVERVVVRPSVPAAYTWLCRETGLDQAPVVRLAPGHEGGDW